MISDSKKEIFGWCLYDFANSSYTTLIVTVAYSVYFTEFVAEGYNGDVLWGRGYALSMILIGIISPVLGALADYSGTKKRYLIIFTLCCIVSTSLLFFVKKGDIISGLVLFVTGNIGYNGGITFYNAFLKDISDKENMGRISGYGWAAGYIGGLLCLAITYPFIKGGFIKENLFYYRLSFPITALFFLSFSIITFIFLRERRVYALISKGCLYWTTGFKRVRETLKERKRFRELFKFFVSYLIYNDGINTIIVFSAIFARRVLSFTVGEIIIYFIVTQITSAIGAYIFGFITDKTGAKKAISITLILWIFIVLSVFFVENKLQFYIIGLTAGICIGSNQSASRTLLGQFAPEEKAAEFFGLFSLTGKLAAVIGPLVYGEIVGITNSHRIAVISIAIFFIIGMFLLFLVNEEEGIRTAENYSEDSGKGLV
ncbi:MAG: MFS transporter [Nitrospirota bacterium]